MFNQRLKEKENDSNKSCQRDGAGVVVGLEEKLKESRGTNL